MMRTYVVLIRGINVGGNNKVPMMELRKCLEEAGFTKVSTYIASGNVILSSAKPAKEIKNQIEQLLPKKFLLNSELIKVLVLTDNQLKSIIDHKPDCFGERPDKYHSDIILLIDMDTEQAIRVFNPNERVDKVWPGEGVIYHQRLSALRTKSHLNRIMGTKPYKSMTVRNWNTIIKLQDLLKASD